MSEQLVQLEKKGGGSDLIPKNIYLKCNPNLSSGAYSITRGTTLNVSEMAAYLFNIDGAASVTTTGTNFGMTAYSKSGATRNIPVRTTTTIQSDEIFLLMDCLDSTSRTVTINE